MGFHPHPTDQEYPSKNANLAVSGKSQEARQDETYLNTAGHISICCPTKRARTIPQVIVVAKVF
jgi:hypothetical protein